MVWALWLAARPWLVIGTAAVLMASFAATYAKGRADADQSHRLAALQTELSAAVRANERMRDALASAENEAAALAKSDAENEARENAIDGIGDGDDIAVSADSMRAIAAIR